MKALDELKSKVDAAIAEAEAEVAEAEAEVKHLTSVIDDLQGVKDRLSGYETAKAAPAPKQIPAKNWNSPPEPKPKPQATPVKTLEPRDCAYCGLKFRPAHALKKYCSAKCAEDSNRTKSAKLYAEKTGKSTKKPEEV